jgi:hypothetical protein
MIWPLDPRRHRSETRSVGQTRIVRWIRWPAEACGLWCGVGRGVDANTMGKRQGRHVRWIGQA